MLLQSKNNTIKVCIYVHTYYQNKVNKLLSHYKVCSCFLSKK